MSEELARLLTLRLELARRIQAAHEAGEPVLVAELQAEAAEVHRAICALEVVECSCMGRGPEYPTSRFDNDGAPPHRRHQ